MKKLCFASAALLGLAFTAPAHATSLTYQLDLSSGDAPAGSAPWVSLTFDDGGNTGSVDLTISTGGLTDQEIMEDLYINFTDTLDVSLLNFAAALGNEAVANDISTGANGFKAGGAGFFDILFDYPPQSGNGEVLFGAGETVTYNITSTDPITASSFDVLSTVSANGQYHAAAHIQRIGVDAEGSGWIADNGPAVVPEPATMLLFGLGLTGLTGFARRRNSQIRLS